uniref:NADPH-dependent FMN reductase-like domain-containing protein n=1 Tax=Fusarium oxysporum (strain Fo5176) TaxID=660025 RepID=A0A0D2XBQ6_FUSOF
MNGHGDLNNSHAGRTAVELTPNPAYAYRSLAIDPSDDVSEIREKYRPFILEDKYIKDDWVAELELSTAIQMVQSKILDEGLDRLRILVLYGSLRSRSYSRLLALEAARILHRLGCDVRVYNPAGLPQKDDIQHNHPKPSNPPDIDDKHLTREQTGIFKQQIDWIPLSTGSVRPTQGRTLAIAQSSVPKAYTQFTSEDEGGRMLPSGNRDRLVDCMEELVKYTIVMRPHYNLFGDRYSEREERRAKEDREKVK